MIRYGFDSDNANLVAKHSSQTLFRQESGPFFVCNWEADTMTLLTLGQAWDWLRDRDIKLTDAIMGIMDD